MKPRFTQKHYEVLADLLSDVRYHIDTAPHLTFDQKCQQLAGVYRTDIYMRELFFADNPKFNYVLFADAASLANALRKRGLLKEEELDERIINASAPVRGGIHLPSTNELKRRS